MPTDNLKNGTINVLLKSGQTVALGPEAIVQIDPLHIGANPYMLNLMSQYVPGNNPLGASDKGLNFNQLLFNTPNVLNNHAQVARMDYNIDSAGRHTIMVRGTLNGASSTPTAGPAIFPGQAPSQTTLDNSRGLGRAIHGSVIAQPGERCGLRLYTAGRRFDGNPDRSANLRLYCACRRRRGRLRGSRRPTVLQTISPGYPDDTRFRAGFRFPVYRQPPPGGEQ